VAPAPPYPQDHAYWADRRVRQAHDLKITSSNPVSATEFCNHMNYLERPSDIPPRAASLCPRCVREFEPSSAEGVGHVSPPLIRRVREAEMPGIAPSPRRACLLPVNTQAIIA
jgi:hypothetical protein